MLSTKWAARWRALVTLSSDLADIRNQVTQMAATEQQLADDLAKIGAGVDAAIAAIADLKAQIAAMGNQTAPVSQEQLDALTAQADGIVAKLSGTSAQGDGSGV